MCFFTNFHKLINELGHKLATLILGVDVDTAYTLLVDISEATMLQVWNFDAVSYA